MKRSRADLIVPVRDRRQRRRYLTLRNAGITFAALTVLFIAITIRSEMQPRHGEGFGRLLERELPVVETKPLEVVREAPPVDDQTAADPMLVAPAGREQWLYDDSAAAMSATASAAIEPVSAPVSLSTRDKDSRLVIVGGPEGVSVVEQTRRRQTLRGGFGRQ
jgi:hypothetical protein